jgi:hypothetical protein
LFGGSATRPTAMTYPNGRVLNVNYAATAADRLGRLDGLAFDGLNVAVPNRIVVAFVAELRL